VPGSPTATNVVPPPPSVSSTGRGGNDSAHGTLLAENVLPPPPSLGGGNALSGPGMGARGSGLGGTLGSGSVLAPSNSGGGGGGSAAVIVSKQPGSTIGLPRNAGTGSLGLSPAGADKPGLEGNGGGSGIGHGSGPGSGLVGEGTGAGRSGAGRGSDPSARSGVSPNQGPGGAGNAPSGIPAVPGVSVTGGSTIVKLPSFDSDPSANDPSAPRRSSLKSGQTFGVDVVATASSAGAFAPYKNLLHGEKHISYIDTPGGTVVMEYAEEGSAGTRFAGPLVAPQQIRADLPAGLPKSQMVVACILDASGNLKNIRVLEPGPASMTAKVLAALRSWKFQPAMRGSEPLEVSAILGFNIDTNDHF
jgi:TonB family protein